MLGDFWVVFKLRTGSWYQAPLASLISPPKLPFPFPGVAFSLSPLPLPPRSGMQTRK